MVLLEWDRYENKLLDRRVLNRRSIIIDEALLYKTTAKITLLISDCVGLWPVIVEEEEG